MSIRVAVLLSLLSLSLSQSPPLRGTFINCGATAPSTFSGREWLPDSGFISQGTSKNLTIPVLAPILSTVRSFPLTNNLHRKLCYVVPVFRGAKYMIRTTYFYGGINAGSISPPVFDQIVDGTLWSVVNTTEDYANGMSSYYEGVFLAQGKTMSLCIGVNSYTDSDPFISALEFVILGGSLYNSTHFQQNGLSLIARHSFGYNGSIIRYPDDHFDRFWEPFGESDVSISKNRNISVSGIWNLPPSKVFETELTSGQSGPLELKWPLVSLQDSMYYIALYFADDTNSSVGPARLLNISINGITYYKNLSVTQEGSAVFATQWPLGGLTTITLTPVGSTSVPLINAGEVFELVVLGGRTLTRDVIAMEQVKSSLQNAPIDWSGDPCMPRQYSWTGVTCSEGPRIRVVTLNLTGMGLSGSLSPSIARMTALTNIWLGNNNLSGSLPDLSSLKMLQTLHLENNQFTGEIPLSLGNIKDLQELFLQNNNLTGQIPNSLIGKPGLDIRTTPGNQLVSPPPS
ncbi:leucine-rich repeat receptor-like serine/threonine-protein kinase At2g14510 [Ricinus communis]|uniref:leucine-rich repeat receptor-like serine/threonine-protein kinase At2g14510 n=1 Tax=Ricinus communis TaxID=3988 RepID=UPI0007723748|nr:leucine-rich repeat receptor-like serine/threonine-protein kinase At2g14510 [Ricinus communis]|eukprot:XP_015573432.1 leucine-rich repeat receptor-like serine/threonine-protein kinase At2g14510 [Ricinus communis]